MAKEIVAGSADFPLKRPREDEDDEVSGASIVSMETNTDKEHDCVSVVIPGWFSEISSNVFRFRSSLLKMNSIFWAWVVRIRIVLSNIGKLPCNLKKINWWSRLLCSHRWHGFKNVVLPGLARALLYLFLPNYSVISRFGTLMATTFEWQGIPAYAIGITQGIRAAIGIGTTIVIDF